MCVCMIYTNNVLIKGNALNVYFFIIFFLNKTGMKSESKTESCLIKYFFYLSVPMYTRVPFAADVAGITQKCDQEKRKIVFKIDLRLFSRNKVNLGIRCGWYVRIRRISYKKY